MLSRYSGSDDRESGAARKHRRWHGTPGIDDRVQPPLFLTQAIRGIGPGLRDDIGLGVEQQPAGPENPNKGVGIGGRQ